MESVVSGHPSRTGPTVLWSEVRPGQVKDPLTQSVGRERVPVTGNRLRLGHEGTPFHPHVNWCESLGVTKRHKDELQRSHS